MDDLRRPLRNFSSNASPPLRQGLHPQGDVSRVPTGTQPPDTPNDRGVRSAGSSRRMKLLLTAGGVLIVVLLATSGFLFWRYTDSSGSDGGKDGAAEAVSQRIIDKVGSLYLVPEGEEPTVAEIRDKGKLKDRAFFDKAQNGDYLVVYGQAGLALIYREPAHKLVNASPVGTSPTANAGEDQQNTAEGSPEEAAR